MPADSVQAARDYEAARKAEEAAEANAPPGYRRPRRRAGVRPPAGRPGLNQAGRTGVAAPGPTTVVRAHAPTQHQSIGDVGIGCREGLGSGGRVSLEQQDGAIDRIGQRAAQQQLAALGRFPGQVPRCPLPGTRRGAPGSPGRLRRSGGSAWVFQGFGGPACLKSPEMPRWSATQQATNGTMVDSRCFVRMPPNLACTRTCWSSPSTGYRPAIRLPGVARGALAGPRLLAGAAWAQVPAPDALPPRHPLEKPAR